MYTFQTICRTLLLTLISATLCLCCKDNEIEVNHLAERKVKENGDSLISYKLINDSYENRARTLIIDAKVVSPAGKIKNCKISFSFHQTGDGIWVEDF
jgi:hypothetical protein